MASPVNPARSVALRNRRLFVIINTENLLQEYAVMNIRIYDGSTVYIIDPRILRYCLVEEFILQYVRRRIYNLLKQSYEIFTNSYGHL